MTAFVGESVGDAQTSTTAASLERSNSKNANVEHFLDHIVVDVIFIRREERRGARCSDTDNTDLQRLADGGEDGSVQSMIDSVRGDLRREEPTFSDTRV